MQALKILIISSFVLAGLCLALALYHYLHVRREGRRQPEGMVSSTPVWGVFPQAYTARGRRHQRLFYAFFAVFVVLCVVLLASSGAF